MTYARIQFERKQLNQVLRSRKNGKHQSDRRKVAKRDDRRLQEDGRGR